MLKYFPSHMLKDNILGTNLFYNFQFFKGISVSKFWFDSCIGFQDKDLFCENKDMFLFCNLIPALTWTNMFELKPKTQFVFSTLPTLIIFQCLSFETAQFPSIQTAFLMYIYKFWSSPHQLLELIFQWGGVLHSVEICIFVFFTPPYHGSGRRISAS